MTWDLPDNSNSDAFRRTLGCFATGVAVAMTVTPEGPKVGITISSFNSVSLEPPLVLWSIAKSADTYAAFARADYFSVNVLAQHQQDLSLRFSTPGVDRFAALDCTSGIGGVPLLREFAACFECSTEHRYEGGDHLIIVGRVHRFEDRDVDPLIYFRGLYHAKGEPAD